VEHSSFTPLVLSPTGGMGHDANVFYKQLAALLQVSDKWKDPYAEILGADFPFVCYAQQFNVSEEQDHHMAITSELLWLQFNGKPSFLFLFNSNCIVLFSVLVIIALLQFDL